MPEMTIKEYHLDTNRHVNNGQYGIPYQTSAAVLFCDMEVLRQADIPSVSFRQSKSSLLAILSEISKLNEEEIDSLSVFFR